MRYTLEATHAEHGNASIVFTARDDMDATLEAIARILDRASTSQLWALGEIVLRNETRTELHRMEGKD
jgi:hypothetical protein